MFRARHSPFKALSLPSVPISGPLLEEQAETWGPGSPPTPTMTLCTCNRKKVTNDKSKVRRWLMPGNPVRRDGEKENVHGTSF